MEQARAAVSSFLGGSGGHKTEVLEDQLPAVTRETVKPHRHEIQTQAVDRELHQHHYHTTVQPIQHQETLPEKHVHNPVPVEHREFHQEDPQVGHDTHLKNLARFKSTATTHETKHTSTNIPAVTGEHFVHHVHEQVQPVIYKEVHQPEVIHTVQPIHEVHHAPSEHHGISLLPERTVEELRSHGIDLEHGSGGIAHHKQDYEGHPRPYNPKYQLQRNPVDIEPEKHYGLHGLEETGHPYESNFQNHLAEPITTALGYKSSISKLGAKPIKTEPGKSAFGYKIEDSGTAVGGAGISPVSAKSSAPVSPVAVTPVKSRDFAANAGTARTSQSLDPRSHWSENESSAKQSVQVPHGTTSAVKAEPRARPDSGISIPDRTTSRGQPSLDQSVSQSATMTTTTTTTTSVPARGPITTTTETEGPTSS